MTNNSNIYLVIKPAVKSWGYSKTTPFFYQTPTFYTLGELKIGGFQLFFSSRKLTFNSLLI